MKSIIQAYSPEEVERIACGEQTVKVCKTAPKETPFKVYMYMTHKGNKFIQKMKTTKGYDAYVEVNYKITGKVVGEYVCKKVEEFNVGSLRSDDIENLGCLSYTELINYFYKPWELDGKTAKQGKALHIPAVKFYDKPKELGEFKTIKCTHKSGSCSDCEIKPNCIKYLSRPPRGWQYVEPLDK